MHDSLRINYKLNGEGWEDRQPIRAIGLGLLALDDLLEKAALIAEGKRRTSKKYKPTKVYGSAYRVGSFEADLILTVASTLSAASAKDIWEILKGALELAKLLTEAKDKNETIQITNNGKKSTIVAGTNISVTVNNYHIKYLQAAEPQLKKFASIFVEEAVNNVSLEVEDGDEINIDLPSGVALANPALYHAVQTPQILEFFEPTETVFVEERAGAGTKLDQPALVTFDQPIKMKCDIIQLNKAEGTGIVEVLANEMLPQGQYNFKVIHHGLMGQLIAAMAQRQVDLTVVQLGRVYPTGPELIISEVSQS